MISKRSAERNEHSTPFALQVLYQLSNALLVCAVWPNTSHFLWRSIIGFGCANQRTCKIDAIDSASFYLETRSGMEWQWTFIMTRQGPLCAAKKVNQIKNMFMDISHALFRVVAFVSVSLKSHFTIHYIWLAPLPSRDGPKSAHGLLGISISMR